MEKVLTYHVWYKLFMERFYKEHPNSSAPRNHLMSMLFDDYLKSKYESEFIVIDGLNQHKNGLTYEQWVNRLDCYN